MENSTRGSSDIHIHLSVNRRTVGLLICASLVAVVGVELGSETLTITTTYPSPSGIYRSIVTTGGNAGAPVPTVLNREAGTVTIGSAANPNGGVSFFGANRAIVGNDANNLIALSNVPVCNANQVLTKNGATPASYACVNPTTTINVWQTVGTGWGWKWAGAATGCGGGKLVGGGGWCDVGGLPFFGGWLVRSVPNGNSWSVGCFTTTNNWNRAVAFAICTN